MKENFEFNEKMIADFVADFCESTAYGIRQYKTTEKVKQKLRNMNNFIKDINSFLDICEMIYKTPSNNKEEN